MSIKSKTAFFPLVFAIVMFFVLSFPPHANAVIYTTNTLKLEAEDNYQMSHTCTSYGTGISVQTPNPKVSDAWLRFQPVNFREGYSSFSVRYAHNVTSYSMWLDIYTNQNGTWVYHGNVSLPSTGGFGTFNTASTTLASSITGKKNVYFFIRTSGSNPQYLCIDYVEFGNPASRQINTSLINNWSLFDKGRPSLSGKTGSGPITINGNGDYIIENKIFYPDKNQYAISIHNHHTGNIIIRNCFFGGKNGAAVDGLDPGNGMGILIYNSSNVTIENNYFEYIQRRAVWAEGNGTTANNNIVIANNKFYCMQAQYYPGSNWGWDNKVIQFFYINGIGNKIWHNRMLNIPGYSLANDWINVYCSSGTYEYPIQVYYNEIMGAGSNGLYNIQGAGIQIADHSDFNDGGEYIYAKYNRLVYPGKAGMNINGGYSNEMSHNYLYHDYNLGLLRFIDKYNVISSLYAWTGVVLFNYSGGPSRDSHHRVIGNNVYFQYHYGFENVTNPPNTTIADNDFTATLYPLDILPYNFMAD